MKIVILDAATLGDVNLSGLEKFGTVETFATTQPEDVPSRIQGAEIIITNKVVINRPILETTNSLKLICVAATGYNIIDIQCAAERGITVTNAVGYSTNSVVAHTFSMLFYLSHHSRYFDDYTRSRQWCKSPTFNHLGESFSELAGKQWGIIGMGTIGRKVADIAQAFGCQVSYFSTSGKNKEQPFECVSLEQLLQQSQIISIHAPLNEKTANLIDKPQLQQMSSQAILLNVSRGGIVNETALASALDDGEIAAAGLDVLAKEPPEASNPLFQLQNKDRLFITPHIAWISRESRAQLITEVEQNIAAFLKGESRNRVI
jgi:glycerate dehydrogenase